MLASVMGVSVMKETSTRYKYNAAIQGFLLWSCWAFYVNYKVSIFAGIKAGLVQGLFSFFATLIVIFLLTKLYNYFELRVLKLLASPTIMIAGLSTILVSAHIVAETPKILPTIAPSLLVAILFISFTTYKLANAKTH